MSNNNFNSPAFPPQLMQDNFGKIVALVPGLSKLEYASIQMLPAALNIWEEKSGKIMHKGRVLDTYFELACVMAVELLTNLEKLQNNENDKETLQIIQ